MTVPVPSVLAAVLTGLAACLAVGFLVPPTPRLAPRVRPYALPGRAPGGRDAPGVAQPSGGGDGGIVGRLFGPPLRSVVSRISRRLDAAGEERLRLRLRQSGLLPHVPDEDRVQEYRMRHVLSGFAAIALGTSAALAVGMGAGFALLLGVLGGIVGSTRWPARLDRAIETRRERMKVELYTINHLLAMTIRVGGGPIQAARRVVERGSGEVVGELAEVLVAHASGLRASEAFERVARANPEPSVARMLRLLASGSELGADLADALRALSEDVREDRRETLRRQATRRRAAMLVPIIGILAPTMLLFVAAPIPSLIFGAR